VCLLFSVQGLTICTVVKDLQVKLVSDAKLPVDFLIRSNNGLAVVYISEREMSYGIKVLQTKLLKLKQVICYILYVHKCCGYLNTGPDELLTV